MAIDYQGPAWLEYLDQLQRVASLKEKPQTAPRKIDRTKPVTR